MELDKYPTFVLLGHVPHTIWGGFDTPIRHHKHECIESLPDIRAWHNFLYGWLPGESFPVAKLDTFCLVSSHLDSDLPQLRFSKRSQSRRCLGCFRFRLGSRIACGSGLGRGLSMQTKIAPRLWCIREITKSAQTERISHNSVTYARDFITGSANNFFM